MNRPARNAFTLIEMIIASAVGLFVLVTAYSAVRAASRTIQSAERMALENRLLRAGFVYALDEIDYWILYDDPLPGGSQPLRGNSTTQLPSNMESRSEATFIPLQYGMPFTPMRDLPPVNHDTAATGVRLRPETRLLATTVDLDDVASGGAIFDADLDRGWDMHRPYVAANPASWYRGLLLEGSGGIRLYGRYALFSNLKRLPTLGHGTDARDPGWRYRTAWAFSTGACVPANRPGWVNETGPFGQADASESRTFTRYENRIDYIWRVLGNYGAIDYLPANTLYGGNHGLRFNWDGALVTIDEARDHRFNGTIGTWEGKPDSVRFGTWNSSAPNLARSITNNATAAIVPASAYSGSATVGFYTNDWLEWGDLGGDMPGSSLSAEQRIWHHRKQFLGGLGHIYGYGDTYNRLMQIPPLTPTRPQSWPDLRLGVMRTVLRGRFTAATFIRWLDQSTGKEVELEICALGTTLRGARQQRNPGGGWASFYGVRFDPATGVLWDNPRMSTDTGYTTSENNDPTLDYPANAQDVPAKR